MSEGYEVPTELPGSTGSTYAGVVRRNKHKSQCENSEETKYDEFFRSSLRHYQSAKLDVSSCSTRFSSTRVRIPGVLERDNIEHQLAIDSTTGIPCIAKMFIDNHKKLRHQRISTIPPNAISLHSADGTPLEISGCIGFTLKLGNKYLPVEALVLPHLGPDAMLIDNIIMKAFRAKLDWAAERLSFQDSNVTIPATHMRRSLKSEYCSVITQTSDEQSVPVWVSKKYVIPAAHEAFIRLFNTVRPQKDTLALIEPRTVTATTLVGIPQHEIWQTLNVARKVTHWCNKTKSALVQVGNPSDRTITLKPKTVVGTISPVNAISLRIASAITHNPSQSSQARIYLTAAFDESFKKSTFNDQQQTQLLDLCTKYRPVFSLTPKELGKCTIAEAKFPFQKNTKLVEHHPYRTNPRAQGVIDDVLRA